MPGWGTADLSGLSRICDQWRACQANLKDTVDKQKEEEGGEITMQHNKQRVDFIDELNQ